MADHLFDDIKNKEIALEKINRFRNIFTITINGDDSNPFGVDVKRAKKILDDAVKECENVKGSNSNYEGDRYKNIVRYAVHQIAPSLFTTNNIPKEVHLKHEEKPIPIITNAYKVAEVAGGFINRGNIYIILVCVLCIFILYYVFVYSKKTDSDKDVKEKYQSFYNL